MWVFPAADIVQTSVSASEASLRTIASFLSALVLLHIPVAPVTAAESATGMDLGDEIYVEPKTDKKSDGNDETDGAKEAKPQTQCLDKEATYVGLQIGETYRNGALKLRFDSWDKQSASLRSNSRKFNGVHQLADEKFILVDRALCDVEVTIACELSAYALNMVCTFSEF